KSRGPAPSASFEIPEPLQHRSHDQRQRHGRVIEYFRKPPAFLRRNEFPPGNRLSVCAAAQPAPAYRLRTYSYAIVVTLQRQLSITAPRQQLGINAELLRPIARHATAHGKNSHAFSRQHRVGKLLEILEGIESQQRALVFLPGNLMQREINPQLR